MADQLERMALAITKEIGWGAFDHFDPADVRRIAGVAIAAMQGWQDIADAPRDGSYVLTCRMGEPSPHFGGDLISGYAEPPEVAQWIDAGDCWTCPQRPHDSWEPTHYMPLFRAPEVRCGADTTDYPLAAPGGLHPAIYRAQIIQAMALEYLKAMTFGSDEEFSLGQAMEAATATWGTEWDSDPQPRTIEFGIEAAQSDLEYWREG